MRTSKYIAASFLDVDLNMAALEQWMSTASATETLTRYVFESANG